MTASGGAELGRLVVATRRDLGARALAAGHDATDELILLLLRHWPHHALARLAAQSEHHRDIVHVGLLARAQVREVWEARHGISPEWETLHGGLVGVAWLILLQTWFHDVEQRQRFKAHSRSIAASRH